MVVHDSSPVCEHCGNSDKRMYQHEYICMSCGVIDGSAMIVDEMSEQRRQWDSGDDHQHHATVAPAARLPRLHSICTQLGTDSLSRRAYTIAKRAAQLFSIDTDQIPQEAACLYLATRHVSGGHVSTTDVVACTMIAAHRRTAQDLQDASLVFTLKSKQVMTSIERVQESVLMGSACLAAAYGYLFDMVGERRSAHLVKEALDHLLGLKQLSEGSRRTLLSSSWGIRSLADDMMKHVQDCRLIGGDSLAILARAMIVMSCELHMGHKEVPPTAFISTILLHTHRCTWGVALARWPGGGQTAFNTHVLQKRRLREYGSIRPQQRTMEISRCDTESVVNKRNTRAAVAVQFVNESRFRALLGTATAAGVTHVCVAMVSTNTTLQRYVEQDPEGVATMMDVCLAAVLPLSPISIYIDPCISALVRNTPGFEYAVCLARKFKAPVSSMSFMPRELMRWGVCE